MVMKPPCSGNWDTEANQNTFRSTNKCTYILPYSAKIMLLFKNMVWIFGTQNIQLSLEVDNYKLAVHYGDAITDDIPDKS